MKLFLATTTSLLALSAATSFAQIISVSPITDYFAVDFNVPDGVANSTNGGSTNLVVGRLDNGNLGRGVITFELPNTLASGSDIASATLRLDYTVDVSDGNVDLYHSVDFNETAVTILSMFDGTFSLATAGVVTSATAIGQIDIDVTDLVKADLDAEGTSGISVFRLQMSGDDLSLAPGDRYVFAQTENGGFTTPELIIAIPEPSVFPLLAAALIGCGLVIRRRR